MTRHGGEKLMQITIGIDISKDVPIEIVKRSDAAKGFGLLPRRWVVERTIA
jgi:transposase